MANISLSHHLRQPPLKTLKPILHIPRRRGATMRTEVGVIGETLAIKVTGEGTKEVVVCEAAIMGLRRRMECIQQW